MDLLWLLLLCYSGARAIYDDTICDNTPTSRLQPNSLLQTGKMSQSIGNADHGEAPGSSKNSPKTLQAILDKSGSDKTWRHGYHRYYETELAPYRDVKNLRILEIGADSGISLGAWLEYFSAPSAVQGIAYGVDAGKAKEKACSLFPDRCDKLEIYSMDQSNVTALHSLGEKNGDGWDIIIDDGSHKPQHQLISFQKLWPKIRPGGLYAIEDIETSYVDDGSVLYGQKLEGGIGQDPPGNAVEQFKRLVDVVNRNHFDHPNHTVFAGADKDVARVSFADGLIFIAKKPADPEWDNYPTHLAFSKKNTSRTFNAYEKSVEPVNSWFKGLD